jgi:hypothetical protein
LEEGATYRARRSRVTPRSASLGPEQEEYLAPLGMGRVLSSASAGLPPSGGIDHGSVGATRQNGNVGINTWAAGVREVGKGQNPGHVAKRIGEDGALVRHPNEYRPVDQRSPPAYVELDIPPGQQAAEAMAHDVDLPGVCSRQHDLADVFGKTVRPLFRLEPGGRDTQTRTAWERTHRRGRRAG